MYPMMQQQWQPMAPPPTQPMDIFASIDKTTYIIVFVGFILGFFMGKTMQPVILKPS
jgi:allophanate hydrolase subunit 1